MQETDQDGERAPESGSSIRWGCVIPIVTVLLLFVGLATIPLIPAGQRDARRAECELMLGSLKGQVRVAYAKSDGIPPETLTGGQVNRGSGCETKQLTGKYFLVVDRVFLNISDGYDAALVACPIEETELERWGIVHFDLGGGEAEFEWVDERPEFVDD